MAYKKLAFKMFDDGKSAANLKKISDQIVLFQKINISPKEVLMVLGLTAPPSHPSGKSSFGFESPPTWNFQ